MQLLKNCEYKLVEDLLKNYSKNNNSNETYSKALAEIIEFFNIDNYKEVLNMFYIHRYEYKYRYPSNRDISRYLVKKLYLEESTIYKMRKEIIYKSAMIFYKYNII